VVAFAGESMLLSVGDVWALPCEAAAAAEEGALGVLPDPGAEGGSTLSGAERVLGA